MYAVLNQENMIYGDLIMSEKEYSQVAEEEGAQNCSAEQL